MKTEDVHPPINEQLTTGKNQGYKSSAVYQTIVRLFTLLLHKSRSTVQQDVAIIRERSGCFVKSLQHHGRYG